MHWRANYKPKKDFYRHSVENDPRLWPLPADILDPPFWILKITTQFSNVQVITNMLNPYTAHLVATNFGQAGLPLWRETWFSTTAAQLPSCHRVLIYRWYVDDSTMRCAPAGFPLVMTEKVLRTLAVSTMHLHVLFRQVVVRIPNTWCWDAPRFLCVPDLPRGGIATLVLCAASRDSGCRCSRALGSLSRPS